jgi:hypothetical protein
VRRIEDHNMPAGKSGDKLLPRLVPCRTGQQRVASEGHFRELGGQQISLEHAPLAKVPKDYAGMLESY